MEGVIGAGLVPLGYEARLEALLAAGVGLWDVIGSARRRGSLDGAIRGHRSNALAELASNLPELRAVGFNGGKSASLGLPLLAPLAHLAFIPLPSSSPAFTMAFVDKARAWMKLRPVSERGACRPAHEGFRPFCRRPIRVVAPHARLADQTPL
jgi:hypoxanthine-DNA glycosylase